MAHSGALAPGEGYSGTWTGRHPGRDVGHLLLPGQGRPRRPATAPSSRTPTPPRTWPHSPAALDIAAAPYADLTAAITVSPALGQIGQTIDLAWVVTNDATHGLAATGAGPWYDRVVLSRDASSGNADDVTPRRVRPHRRGRRRRQLHRRQDGDRCRPPSSATATCSSSPTPQQCLRIHVREQQRLARPADHDPGPGPERRATSSRPRPTAVFGETVGLDFTVRNTGTGPTTGHRARPGLAEPRPRSSTAATSCWPPSTRPRSRWRPAGSTSGPTTWSTCR